MKKLITIFLFIITLCACAIGSGTFAFAEGSESAETDKLFLPSSYEQYLELTNPTDFAISDKYIAIADKKDSETTVLYLFDKTANKYKSCHISTQNKVSSLNFYATDGQDYLFFLETGNTVKYIDCATFSAPITVSGFTASTMLFCETGIYYAIQTDGSCNVHHATISGMDITYNNEKPIGDSLNTLRPSFCEQNGKVYFAADKQVFICTTSQYVEYVKTADSINYFAIYGENTSDIVYTNTGGLVYIANSASSSIQNISVSVVKYYNGYAYFLLEHGIVQYDIESASFTDYEIGKYSSSENRLNAPTDISSCGDKIIIADNGNERISVYDKGVYSSFTPTAMPTILCAGDSNLLAANGAQIYLYDYNGNEKGSFNLTGNVISATYSVGEYFIITTEGTTCKIDAAALVKSEEYAAQITGAVSIAADLYGDIYVLYSSGQISVYTANSFLSETASGTSIAEFNSNCKKLLVDYSCNLYGLSGDTIYIYDGESVAEQSINLSDFVYGVEEKTATSFALNLHDDGLYILSDGFIVRKAANVSTLKNISAEGLYTELFSNTPSNENLIVDVPAGAIAVKIDVSTLSADTSVLPYISYGRLDENKTATVLAKTEAGYVIAYYTYTPAQTSAQLPTREYTVCLISSHNLTQPTINGEYKTNEEKVGYLSSDVNLYRRPIMQNYVVTEKLNRNSKVNVISKISLSQNVLDCDYYYVEIDGNYGFIPASFITETPPVELENQSFKYQTLKKGKSATLTAETGESITLSDKEQLKVYDTPAEKDGYKVVSYEKDGIEYFGEVSAKSLYTATPIVIVTLVIIMLVTASVLLSTCYLIFRKNPTLE